MNPHPRATAKSLTEPRYAAKRGGYSARTVSEQSQPRSARVTAPLLGRVSRASHAPSPSLSPAGDFAVALTLTPLSFGNSRHRDPDGPHPNPLPCRKWHGRGGPCFPLFSGERSSWALPREIRERKTPGLSLHPMAPGSRQPTVFGCGRQPALRLSKARRARPSCPPPPARHRGVGRGGRPWSALNSAARPGSGPVARAVASPVGRRAAGPRPCGTRRAPCRARPVPATHRRSR